MLKGGFSIKKRETKIKNVTTSGFQKIEEDRDKAEIIHGVDSTGIIGTNKIVEEKPLVIPCIKVNKWAIGTGTKRTSQIDKGEEQANKKQFQDNSTDDAVNAIIHDSNRFLQNQQTNENGKILNIPLLMQNKIPENTETEEGPLKVDIRPDSSTLDDYDQVPIGSFGLGMLRGMGWKEEEGIGKTKQKVDLVEVNVRPTGLGLGATHPAGTVKKKKEQDEMLTVSYRKY